MAPNHAPRGIHWDRTLSENIITTHTPAPEDIPNKNGLANGFRNIPCNRAPETPKADPVSKAANERGNRISRITRIVV